MRNRGISTGNREQAAGNGQWSDLGASVVERAGLAELVEAHERLLELHRELLSQYAEVLERRAGESVTVAVTAGPFTNAGSVREFERALAALPGVSAVTVREYLGEDRVQIDVQLLAG